MYSDVRSLTRLTRGGENVVGLLGGGLECLAEAMAATANENEDGTEVGRKMLVGIDVGAGKRCLDGIESAIPGRRGHHVDGSGRELHPIS